VLDHFRLLVVVDWPGERSGVHRIERPATGSYALVPVDIKQKGKERVGEKSVSGKGGDLNGSTQHQARTHLALKTRAKSLVRVRSDGTLPRLGFVQVKPNTWFSRGSIAESAQWMVLHRPVELTAFIGRSADR
jgi:hypothetical protein